MNLRTLGKELEARARGRVAFDYPLAGLTTYRLGGPAAVYLEPVDLFDIEILGSLLRESMQDVPVLAMGRGSNVVVSDRGFPGIVVRLGMTFSWIAPTETEGGSIEGMTAGASTPLPMLANWGARRGLTGMEFAIAIPGSVGGGIRMNAGAHGGEMADTLDSVRLFDLDEPAIATRRAPELALQYRRSGLSERQIVLDATFSLTPGDPDEVRARMDAYRRHRAETQPGAVQNAGSVFKNPPGDAAGRLVDAAGLKGFRVGGAAVSDLHANFFVAEDGSASQDVFELVHAVRARVKEVFGVELEPEIRFVGEFDEPAVAGGTR